MSKETVGVQKKKEHFKCRNRFNIIKNKKIKFMVVIGNCCRLAVSKTFVHILFIYGSQRLIFLAFKKKKLVGANSHPIISLKEKIEI